MRTSEVLNRAADLIEERGWAQAPDEDGWFPKPESTAPLCLEGACIAAALGSGLSAIVVAVVRDYLPERNPGVKWPAWLWNDQPDRTAAEVIEVLRACAVIEAAKESDRELIEAAS